MKGSKSLGGIADDGMQESADHIPRSSAVVSRERALSCFLPLLALALSKAMAIGAWLLAPAKSIGASLLVKALIGALWVERDRARARNKIGDGLRRNRWSGKSQ